MIFVESDVLNTLSSSDLVALTRLSAHSSELELELAERLFEASREIDILVARLREASHGCNP